MPGERDKKQIKLQEKKMHGALDLYPHAQDMDFPGMTSGPSNARDIYSTWSSSCLHSLKVFHVATGAVLYSIVKKLRPI